MGTWRFVINLSYKTNNDTVNLNASIIPNTYDIVNLGTMRNVTFSNVVSGNIIFGNPYLQLREGQFLSNIELCL